MTTGLTTTGRWRPSRPVVTPSVVVVLEISVDDPATPDVAALIEQHLALMRALSPPEDVHALDLESLRHPAVLLVSCRSHGEVLGIGALKQIDPGQAEVTSMYVTEAARGRGIARTIVDHLLAVARQRGLQRVSLETGSQPEFAPARSLYRSVGFEPCGPFGSYEASEASAFLTLDLRADTA